MKKIGLLILTILTLFLVSCGQDTTQLAKEEFSKYYNGENKVFLCIDDYLYFEKNTLDLSDLVDGNEYNNGLIVTQENILFSTSKENSMFNFTLNIYESNLQGTEIKKIFSKDGFKTHPLAYAIDDFFYIEHYSNNALDFKSRLIDKYTISTGIYENIAKGKDCNLFDYYQSAEQSKYNVEVIENISSEKHGEFIITNTETGITKVIDDEYLKNTIYIESMEKFNYNPKRFDISNGHILLTYGIVAGNGWNYSHLVFEYDFDLNILDYKLLAFPYDSVPIDIVYIV